MKKILNWKLKILAKLVLRKYKPMIIAITGSVGKTSAKEAIYTILKDTHKVGRSMKNYNNELGLPLSILGYDSSFGKNIFKWFAIFFLSIKKIILRDAKYPEVLILEMGADKPGDIDYLTSIAKPHIAIITTIGHSHLMNFGDIKKIAKEKRSILRRLGKDDWAVLNQDDEHLQESINGAKTKLISFGKSEKSNLRVSNVATREKDGVYGTSFKVNYKENELPVFLPNSLGWQHAQAATTGIAVALIMGMNLAEIGKALYDYRPVKGRSNLIEGVKKTWILDDSYNASPESSKTALDMLKSIDTGGRRIAVFGDMLELGSYTETGHIEVGKKLAKLGIDYLFVVGERALDIAHGAKKLGMSEDQIYHFSHTSEAGTFLQERMKENDVILIKGSRGSKMEQVVYEVMAKPWEADDLLVASVTK